MLRLRRRTVRRYDTQAAFYDDSADNYFYNRLFRLGDDVWDRAVPLNVSDPLAHRFHFDLVSWTECDKRVAKKRSNLQGSNGDNLQLRDQG